MRGTGNEKEKLSSCNYWLVLVGIYFFTRPDALGNISHAFNEETSNVSNISFDGTENERIKFSFKSNVKSGELNISLYDSNGNLVYELDKAKALETYYVFEKTDIYTLEAKCENFVGDYEISVYDAN